jgi:hypothetical protein
MKSFDRDSTIRLRFNFKDAFGDVINPAAAEISISYCPHGGEPTYATYALVQSGDDWVYEWDSSVASAGVISVHAQTLGGPPTAAIDTEFRLKANRANRELTGDW